MGTIQNFIKMINKNILVFIILLCLLAICFLLFNTIHKGTSNSSGFNKVVIEESNDTIEVQFANKIVTKILLLIQTIQML